MDDKVLIDLLVQWAACEEDLVAAAHTLEHHTDRDRHLLELQDEYREDAAAAVGEDQDATLRLRAKESELRAAEAELAVKRDREVGLSDRRQHRALLDEIAALEQRIATLEEEGLALLGGLDAKGREAAEAHAAERAQAEKGAAERMRLGAETDQARNRHAEIETEMARLRDMLPDPVRRHIDRLRKQGGRAVVRVEGAACGGCFGQLPAQQAIDADKGRALVRCAGCARYVVHRPWS